MNFRAPSSDHTTAVAADEIEASVGLALLPGVGPRTILRWLDGVGSAAAVWRMIPSLARGRANAEEVLAAHRTLRPERIVAQARARGMNVFALADPAYPGRLRAIPDPPVVLYVRGALELRPAVAIVGSRRATPYGRAAAGRLAADLAMHGVCVVSGLARGIDAAAHVGALDAGGCTVAVLGCGLDVVYPREHRSLRERVAGGGALVSEFPLGTPPLPGHFVRRNRLISGLSLGVVVVEGAQDSGALVTADYALDQGREVFAVPGSIFSPRSRAPHELLRQGARVVEDVDDILHELQLTGLIGPPEGRRAASGVSATSDGAAEGRGRASPDAERVLAVLDGGPRLLDEVIEESGLAPATVAAAVTTLEIRGLIEMLPGQMVMRTSRMR